MFALEERLLALEKLGRFMGGEKAGELAGLQKYFGDDFRQSKQRAAAHNPWFTPENIDCALEAWSQSLTRENLEKWVSAYPPKSLEPAKPRSVAIIMAGNIPLVGFHDLLSVLVSGHHALCKPSGDDDQLLPFLAQVLVAIESRFADRIRFADGQIRDFDAVIATGSNNSARYFYQYFGKYPHIIRQNRSSLAILNGRESEEDLVRLSEDVFRYFGLGCRNISKLYLPEGYELDQLFEAFYPYHNLIDHQKYANNYDYHRAVMLLEKQRFLENGFLILRERQNFHAPVSVLHYEFYQQPEHVQAALEQAAPELQCVVAPADWEIEGSLRPGHTQRPALWDYADRVDTLKFLSDL